jgi:hypothetical protein
LSGQVQLVSPAFDVNPVRQVVHVEVSPVPIIIEFDGHVHVNIPFAVLLVNPELQVQLVSPELDVESDGHAEQVAVSPEPVI